MLVFEGAETFSWPSRIITGCEVRNQPQKFLEALSSSQAHFGRSYGTPFVVIQFQVLDTLSPHFHSELLLASIPRFKKLFDNDTPWTFQNFPVSRNLEVIMCYIIYMYTTHFNKLPHFGGTTSMRHSDGQPGTLTKVYDEYFYGENPT